MKTSAKNLMALLLFFINELVILNYNIRLF